MTRPKDKLPEKLPPVEPDTKEETRIIKEEELPTPEEVIEKFNKEVDPGIGETDAKEAQPDKYPSHSGKKGEIIHNVKPGTYRVNEPGKAEQPFLFGEADQILNALETELAEWKGTYERIDESLERLVKKMEHAEERITSLTLAVKATRKHATMKEDPAPPEKEVKLEKEYKETVEKLVENIQMPEVQPKPETTTADTAPVIDDVAAKGAAERNKATEDLIVKFRNPTQPLPELLFPGDIIVTSWETGPYRIEKITGPYKVVDHPQGGKELITPDHYSIQCSDVDAKRNKDGRLAKNYEYSYLNMVIAVGNRFLSVYADSQDEVVLTGEATDKKKDISKQEPDPKQEPVEAKKPEEEIY